MLKPKELRQLAKVCREMGIYELKCPEFEVKIDLSVHTVEKKVKAAAKPAEQESLIKSLDTVSDEDLLLWSSAPGGEPVKTE